MWTAHRASTTFVGQSGWARVVSNWGSRVSGPILLTSLCCLASCGDGKPPEMLVTGHNDADVQQIEAAGAETRPCVPDCGDRLCGDDDCGGSCGTCSLTETCTAAGACTSIPCVNSLDCPEDLVCEEGQGECVGCVGAEDCPAGEQCGLDYLCHGEHPCQSDKDCKSLQMLCDKERGECVQCVEIWQCDEGQVCQTGYCVDALCTPGELTCDGDTVMACPEDGSGFIKQGDCLGKTWCDKGSCLPYQCEPGKVWCEGETALSCSADGKTITGNSDCGQLGQACFDGLCTDLVCEPYTIWCEGNSVAATCDETGMGVEQALCPADFYCEEGVCLPMECNPGTSFCDGEVASVCNSLGTDTESTVDCALSQQHCFGGECISTVCNANTFFCVDGATSGTCAADGMSFLSTPCPPGNFCSEGTCQLWVCQPSAVYCAGNTATTCNSEGSALSSELDCDNSLCIQGECKPVICEADALFCMDTTTVGLCNDNGTQMSPSSCPADHSCKSGQCLPWLCSPDAPLCIGTIATSCSADGLSTLPEGNDCWAAVKLCEAGECVPCPPQCDGKECGDDGCAGSCGQCPEGLSCAQSQCTDCNDGNDIEWDGCTSSGSYAEFQVNTHAVGKQHGTGVDAWDDGSYIVVWSGAGEESTNGVFLRRFAPDGSATTDDIWVDAPGSGSRTQARVRVLPGGNYVVVWRRGEVFSRLFSADNAPLTNVTQVSSNDGSGTHTEPTVDYFSDNSYVVMWHMNNSVFAQRFTAVGGKIGQNFVISQGTGRVPSVRVLADDGLVATYHRHADGSGNGIFARHLSALMTPYGDQYLVNQTTNQNQEVAVLARLHDDVLVAIWTSDKQDGSGWGVFGQRFNPDGTKVGSEFQANTYTKGSQGAVWASNNKIIEYRRTALAAWSSGQWIVVWESHGQTGNDTWDVYAQRFDSDGTKVGLELPVNIHIAGTQETCSVAALPDKAFVVTWASGGQDGDSWGVFAQRFNADGERLFH
jgi:hypothetical protein